MHLIPIPIPILVGWNFCFKIKLYRCRGRSSVASHSGFSTNNHSPVLILLKQKTRSSFFLEEKNQSRMTPLLHSLINHGEEPGSKSLTLSILKNLRTKWKWSSRLKFQLWLLFFLFRTRLWSWTPRSARCWNPDWHSYALLWSFIRSQ